MELRFTAIVAGFLFLVAPILLSTPNGIPDAAWLASGLALTMALWWLTEAFPLAATTLLPLAVTPLLGIADFGAIAISFGHPLIILFSRWVPPGESDKKIRASPAASVHASQYRRKTSRPHSCCHHANNGVSKPLDQQYGVRDGSHSDSRLAD